MLTVKKVWFTNWSGRGEILVNMSIGSPSEDKMPHVKQRTFKRFEEETFCTTIIGLFDYDDLVILHEAIGKFIMDEISKERG